MSCPETQVSNYHYSLRNSPEERTSHCSLFDAACYELQRASLNLQIKYKRYVQL
jgi:hypothetical protein